MQANEARRGTHSTGEGRALEEPVRRNARHSSELLGQFGTRCRGHSARDGRPELFWLTDLSVVDEA